MSHPSLNPRSCELLALTMFMLHQLEAGRGGEQDQLGLHVANTRYIQSMMWRQGSGWGKLSCFDLEASGIELIPQLGRGNFKVRANLGYDDTKCIIKHRGRDIPQWARLIKLSLCYPPEKPRTLQLGLHRVCQS